MSNLRITLFRSFHITNIERSTEVKLTRDLQMLLAYLLIFRHRTHSREILASVFWGHRSQEKARGSLNTALWRMRRVFESEGLPADNYLVSLYPDELRFNQESQYWLDIEAFELVVNRVLCQPFHKVNDECVRELEKATILYQGELLECCFDDWVIQERERLRNLLVNSFMYLFLYYRVQGLLEYAIAYGNKILEMDPLREEIQRELMRIYLKNHQRAKAARQYEICRGMLAHELGISPMEETQALYNQILSDQSPQHLLHTRHETMDVAQIIGQLNQASKMIALAKEQIHHAMSLILTSEET